MCFGVRVELCDIGQVTVQILSVFICIMGIVPVALVVARIRHFVKLPGLW